MATHDGQSLSGLIAQESAEAVVLVTPRGGEVRLPRSAIEEIRPSRESIMPRGLEANMSRDDLSDLVAFLSNLK